MNSKDFEISVYKLAKLHHYGLVLILGSTAYGVAKYNNVSFYGSLAIGLGTAFLVDRLDFVGFKNLNKPE